MRRMVCVIALLSACMIHGTAASQLTSARASEWTRRRGMRPGKTVDPDAACARIATVAEIASYAGGATCIYLTHATAYGRWDWQATTCGTSDGVACQTGTGGRYWARAMGTPRTWLPRYVYIAGDTDDATIARLTAASKNDVGGVVQLDRMYTLRQPMQVYSGITYRGNGIRRACSPRATLTAPTVPSDTCITVDTSAGWVAGEYGIIVPSASYRSGTVLVATAAGTPAGPNTLCFSAGVGVTASAGWYFIRTHMQIQQITPGGSSGPTPGMVLEDFQIDGNKTCNDGTHDWRYNDVGAVKSATLRRVHVYDTPSEGFTICGSIVQDSRGDRMSGSFLHKSCSTGGIYDYVVRNVVRNVNIIGDAIMEHSEGAITLSANAGNIIATGNDFADGSEGVFGNLNGDDSGIVATGNTFARFARRYSRNVGVTDVIDLDNNVWIDVP